MTRALDGLVAIVTGGGRGIGRAEVERLASYGATVIVNDAGVATDGSRTDESPAEELAESLRADGASVEAHHGDIADTATADALVALAIDRFGRVDAVVNNAGIGRPHMLFNLADDEWDDVLAVHLRGTFGLTRAACRWWREQSKAGVAVHGRVINTSTGLLLLGGAGQSNYVAAKAGVLAFTEAVAQEMAKHGVTANTIMPGAMTRLAAVGWRTRRMEAPSSTSPSAGSASASARSREAFGDVGFDPTDPVHVAELVCYLASPAAAWISGQTFQVSGGRIQHVQPWLVRDELTRADSGWTLDDLMHEMPRFFGAGPRPPDPPPAEWSARRQDGPPAR